MSGHQLVDSMRDRPRRVRSSTITPVSLGPDFTRAMEGHVLFPPFETVGDIATAIRCGDPIRGDQRQEGPYPYLGASGQIDSHHEFNFDGRYLIVSQDGSIGNAWVQTGRFWANNHVWIVSIRPSIDIHAAATYLNCVYPYWRGMTTGSVVPKVTAEALSLVPVVTACWASDAQRYIGDKVRLAEQLRERARSLEAQFRKSVEVTVTATSVMVGKTSRVQTTELGRNLNPGAYAPDRRAVRAAIRKAGGRMLDALADIESPTTNGYSPNDAYVGLDAIDSATCGLKPSTAGTEAVAGTARLLREGPAISRLRPYLKKVTYIPPALAGGIGSTELLLVRPKAGVDGWFLYGVLKLESSVRQLNPVATGSTHPRVDRDDVLELLVPWRDDHATLGAKLRVAQACYSASATLTAVATLLVEHLIEGKLSEGDLSAAQKALESGDRGPDRAILQALRQNGNPAQPLVADLDGLYGLLDELDQETNA